MISFESSLKLYSSFAVAFNTETISLNISPKILEYRSDGFDIVVASEGEMSASSLTSSHDCRRRAHRGARLWRLPAV